MKHIVLFENFINEAGESESLKFQFFPFDKQGMPQGSLPDEADFSQLVDMGGGVTEGLNEAELEDKTWQPGTGAGLYIVHKPTANGGVMRAVLRSLAPLTFDIASFDKEYEKVDEQLGVNSENFTEKNMNFINQVKENLLPIYNYFSKGEATDVQAELGGFYY